MWHPSRRHQHPVLTHEILLALHMDQQLAFQNGVEDYLEAECPINRALAPHETGKPDLALWEGLMQLGIGGIMVPEEHGGLGLGLLDLAVVMEPVGRFAAPGPFLDHN